MEIRIKQDEDCSSPRDDTCLGIMVCFHKKYDLGDKHDLKHEDFISWDTMIKHLKEEKKATHILPLFLLDHSGITMNTTSFSCPWDSGQVGFIYATAKTITKTGVRLEDVEEQLRAEVKSYDRYISGDVWGYVLKDRAGNELDSCWGFHGREAVEEAAKEAEVYQKAKISKQGSFRIVIALDIWADSAEDAYSKAYRTMGSVDREDFQWESTDEWFNANADPINAEKVQEIRMTVFAQEQNHK